jgi:NAD(P)-dependent dehydrogenase (short-subunit alcohol dehydrogenase family)
MVCEERDNGPKTAIVTGYGGIAYEVAAGLCARGWRVIVAGRNREKGEAAVARLNGEPCDPESPRGEASFEPLDLFDPASIKDFCARVAAAEDRIDAVLCVAGVMMPDDLALSSAGVERQFAVNYLGHYEVVGRLLPLLLRAADPRVVTFSSVANRPARFDLADATAARGYDASISYALSKLCCLMYAVELAARVPRIRACCVHPGLARTQLFDRSGGFTMRLLQGIFFVLPFIRQSSRGAAAPALYAATSADAVPGAYYGPLFTIMGPPRRALMPARAGNARLRAELWSLSEKLTGVRYGDRV